MSRLDDELKIAFQRREPSADFAARVLARINDAPAVPAKPGKWQRLAGVLAMPAFRYAAAGAMALLLIVVGILVLRPAGVTPATPEAATLAHQEDGGATNKSGGTLASGASSQAAGRVVTEPRAGLRPQSHHRAATVAAPRRPSPEAEAAKEKVLFALQITSETLNDAQRAISDDRSTDERPEPVHNR
jgi:hypothetical protein